MKCQRKKPGTRNGLVICLGITGLLLVLFYLAVALAPPIIRGLFARSISNYRLIAEAALARGDPDAAVAVLERAAKELPREVYFERPEFMYDWIGRIRKEQGRTTDSLAAFLRAQNGYFQNIRLRGYLPQSRLIGDIIEAYFETGNPGGAYNEARVAMDFYPTRAASYLVHHEKRAATTAPAILRDLARLELKAGRIASARENLSRSLAGDRALAESHFWLGRLEESANRPDGAVRQYEAELAVFPFNDNAATRLALLGKQLGRPTDAVQSARDEARSALVASFEPDDPSRMLASLFGIDASVKWKFKLDRPAEVLAAVAASSTPFDGIYGWIEIQLDGRHVQTLYIDGDGWGEDGGRPHTYFIGLNDLTPGAHKLGIVNLSDGHDETDDRNTFLHAIRLYRIK